MSATEAEVLRLSTRPVAPSDLIRSIWARRDLIATLARKEFFVRYRRARLGAIWAAGLPLIQATVLSIVFSHVVRIRTSTSYPVFVFTGMSVWTYFTNTVTAGSTAIVDNTSLTNKIYFPRAVLPLVQVRANLYGLAINVVIVFALALGFGVHLDAHVLILLPASVLLVLLSGSMVLTLSALHVYFRDIRYIVQAVFTGLLYLTPVFLPLQRYPTALRNVVLANPITGVVQLFHCAIAGSADQWGRAVLVTGGWTLVLAVVAVYLHCTRDRVLSDLL
ncbi:MAG: lipopolysaccharide transport system permease protein [Pseudonocardiales bacterium]|nr:lipopolysaccharide transport system permease protein [Pseudonocardiales bacterium]